MLWIALIVLAFMIPEILSTVLDSRLGRALAARVEDRRVGSGDDVVVDRVRYLEGEVDRLSRDVHRLHEEGEFLQRLLTERSEDRLPGGTPD
ncbi:hypothetical protein BH23GEM11_BH23GEM11_01050 [soil metagenome]